MDKKRVLKALLHIGVKALPFLSMMLLAVLWKCKECGENPCRCVKEDAAEVAEEIEAFKPNKRGKCRKCGKNPCRCPEDTDESSNPYHPKAGHNEPDSGYCTGSHDFSVYTSAVDGKTVYACKRCPYWCYA